MVANINIHKLDAAFDIDPLFHKMSKAFDEGGAKGLLLANLAVSRCGCNIVFDSTLEEEPDRFAVPQETKDDDEALISTEVTPSVDVTSLVNKLNSMLSAQGQSIQEVPLVPQLASLRQDFASLEKEGYVEQVKTVRTDVQRDLKTFSQVSKSSFMLPPIHADQSLRQ
jgi:condensin complex subunit 2